jgi:pyruvate formate lyase activating enzyme
MTPEEVVARILPDRPFFRERGGVTLSGGEPMEQPAFAAALAILLHRENIHVAVETCGYAAPEAYKAILPYTGLFLFDWKITDPEEHRKWTGQDNRLIRENLEMLYREGAEIILRCPVIPGVNDTPEHFRGIGKLTEAVLRPHRDGALEVRAEGLPEILLDGEPIPMEKTACGWKFLAQAGKEYALRCE